MWRMTGAQRRRPAVGCRCAFLLIALVASSSSLFALDPALTVSQYAHTAWRSRDGFADGVIGSITQTPDGYLWLGTDRGLLRFDGVRAIPWQPAAGQSLPSTRISALLSSRDGTLWIGTGRGLASWKDSKLVQYEELAAQQINSLVEDADGVVWVGSSAAPTGKLCAIRASRP